MKKIILLPLAILIISKLTAQTTQDEYNYVTKGYKIQKDAGLDMKKGYELQDIDNATSTLPNGAIERQAWLKALNRTGPNGKKTIAAYMIIYQLRDKYNDRQYLCVPDPSSSKAMMDSFFTSLNPPLADNSAKLQLIVLLLSRSLKWK